MASVCGFLLFQPFSDLLANSGWHEEAFSSTISYETMTEQQRAEAGLVAPTILELAGAPIPNTVQGESFVPVMEGKAEGRSEPFFYQYFQEQYAPAIPTTLAIRTPEWKYIHLPYEDAAEGNLDELYRLSKDPHEMKNLINAPEAAAQLKKMQGLLADALEKYDYVEPPYKYEPPVAE
jgi:arylsulfatase A-like enzyme